jgi:hypothetical protein
MRTIKIEDEAFVKEFFNPTAKGPKVAVEGK